MTESDERAIGRLEGKIDMMLAEQIRAADARKLTSDTLARLDRKIDATDSKVSSIDARLEKVEGPVAEFSQWRERGIGALMLISFVAASVGGIITAYGKKVWTAIAGS